jgi:hypothetical protein
MSTPAQRLAARTRNRALAARKKAGTVRLAVVCDRLWLSELLARSGIGHADDDDPKALEARLQQLLDVMIGETQREA